MSSSAVIVDLCGARNRTGGTCRQVAGAGTGHVGAGPCKFHGGSTPTGELGGALTLARRELSAMGRPLPVAPEEAIMECIAIAWGEVHYATDRIAELEAEGEELAGPTVSTIDRPLKEEKGAESLSQGATETHSGPPALSIWVRARREAMDRVVSFSATALKAGIEELKVKIAERQAEVLADVLRAFAVGMGLDPTVPEVRAGMRQALILVKGGAAEIAA